MTLERRHAEHDRKVRDTIAAALVAHDVALDKAVDDIIDELTGAGLVVAPFPTRDDGLDHTPALVITAHELHELRRAFGRMPYGHSARVGEAEVLHTGTNLAVALNRLADTLGEAVERSNADAARLRELDRDIDGLRRLFGIEAPVATAATGSDPDAIVELYNAANLSNDLRIGDLIDDLDEVLRHNPYGDAQGPPAAAWRNTHTRIKALTDELVRIHNAERRAATRKAAAR